MLDRVHSTLVLITNLVSNVKKVVDNIAPTVSGQIKNTTKQLKEQLDSIEAQ